MNCVAARVLVLGWIVRLPPSTKLHRILTLASNNYSPPSRDASEAPGRAKLVERRKSAAPAHHRDAQPARAMLESAYTRRRYEVRGHLPRRAPLPRETSPAESKSANSSPAPWKASSRRFTLFHPMHFCTPRRPGSVVERGGLTRPWHTPSVLWRPFTVVRIFRLATELRHGFRRRNKRYGSTSRALPYRVCRPCCS